uniref:Uncharacterized protein n=1 Tax=Salvator merianae TaxID=96440 RepID=A0A8D0C815_SALMN
MKMQWATNIYSTSLHYIRKYNHFGKHHKNTSVHSSPCFRNDQDNLIQCPQSSKSTQEQGRKAI